MTGENNCIEGLTIEQIVTIEQRVARASPLSRELLISDDSYLVGIDISNIKRVYENLMGTNERKYACAIYVRNMIEDLIDPEKFEFEEGKGEKIYALMQGTKEEVKKRLYQISQRLKENFPSLSTGIAAIQDPELCKKLFDGNEEKTNTYSAMMTSMEYLLECALETNMPEVISK